MLTAIYPLVASSIYLVNSFSICLTGRILKGISSTIKIDGRQPQLLPSGL